MDRLVKGAPPPDMSPDQVAAEAKSKAFQHSITAPIPPAPATTHDPRDALPSSPPQIYLNLLILEASLRLQYLSLRTRLRLHLLLLAFLAAWILLFTYLLFLRPREDGRGVGGSVYWMLEAAEKLGWCSGLVTALLFGATGMYDRGVRQPRRFLAHTNRGLRGFNLKVVVVRGGLFAELASWPLVLLDPFGWGREPRVNFQLVPRDIEALGKETSREAAQLLPPDANHPSRSSDPWNAHAARHGLREEDLAPGGDTLRLLLLPKPFSPDFREGWDAFRLDYWERENTRRAALRALVRTRARAVARKQGGWLWWTGWRGWRAFARLPSQRPATRRKRDLERLALRDRPASRPSSSAGLPPGSKSQRLKLEQRLRDGSQSRGSSRSSTPAPHGDNLDPHNPPSSRRASVDGKALSSRHRRTSSSASSTSGSIPGSRRPRKPLANNERSRLSASETVLQDWDYLQGGSGAGTLGPMTKLSDHGPTHAGSHATGAGSGGGGGSMRVKREEEAEADGGKKVKKEGSPTAENAPEPMPEGPDAGAEGQEAKPLFAGEIKAEPGEL